MLADDFAASGDFLQQDLHHVHLTDGETLHFGHGFLHLEFVLGRLEILQLAHDGRRRVSRFPAGQYFAHLSRVDLVLRRIEKLVITVASFLIGLTSLHCHSGFHSLGQVLPDI